MSVLVDKDGLPARPPGERTDTDAPSGVDPVHLHGPPVALGDRVQESKPDTTSFGPQFKEALHDFMKTWRAPEPRELGSRDEEAEPSAPTLPVWIQLMNAIEHFTKTWVAPAEPVRVAAAPTTKDVLAAAPFDAVAAEAEAPSGVGPALAHAPLAAGSTGVQESDADTTCLGSRLLDAIGHSKTTLAAPEEPVVAAPAPPTREVLPVSPPRRVEVISVLGPAPTKEVLSASPYDLQSVLASIARATTAEEAIAVAKMFSERVEPILKVASDPAAALGAIFGSEIVATVTEVCAAAVVDLEAEAAATGEPVTDQAATRIARSMVDRVTQRAGRTMALAPRVCLVPRVRTQRAPRARRAPRRAVRLSAVASAGDGPPPPPWPSAHAPLCAWDGSQLERLHVGHGLVAQRDDVEEHLGDLRKRDLTSAPRTLLRAVVRPYPRWLRVSLREASVVRRDVLAESCRLATRPTSRPDRVQRLRPAFDTTGRAGLIFREIGQANHARHDDQRAQDAGPNDDPWWLAMTRSGRRRCGVERACLATERGRGDRHDRAAVALVSLALARDALREEMRVGGDATTWVVHSRWPCASPRPASTLVRCGAREGGGAWDKAPAFSFSYGARGSIPGVRRPPSTPPTITRSGRTTDTSGRWRGAGWCLAAAAATRARSTPNGAGIWRQLTIRGSISAHPRRAGIRSRLVRDPLRSDVRATPRPPTSTRYPHPFPEREAPLFFEHVAMGPPVQSVIESISAVRPHGLRQHSILTQTRADASRWGRDAPLVADSTWRHSS
jgi:hypothetical protein